MEREEFPDEMADDQILCQKLSCKRDDRKEFCILFDLGKFRVYMIKYFTSQIM